jgi:hypothetical protein
MTQAGEPRGTRASATVPGAERVSAETLRQSAEQIIDDVPFFGRMAKDPKARSHMLASLAAVPLPEAIVLELSEAHEARHEVYLHLVRTALTAIWLARTAAPIPCDAGMAAAAGLLHDIGMLHVDPQILDPDHLLTAGQHAQLYAHPERSTALLKQVHGVYPAEVVRAVGEHHECLDGSGYPRNLVGDGISPLGKLLSLAQVVAAMFAPGRNSPEMRLSVLLRMTWHRYDKAMEMQVLSLLKPHLDVMSAELQLLDDPIAHLCEINRLLRQWPLQLEGAAGMTPARKATLATLAQFASQMQRVLAGVGAVPEQLVLLANDAQDDALLAELTLLTREASWQLGTLARQTRRRWKAQDGEVYPATLQKWLDETGALLAAVSGTIAEDPEEPRAHGPRG